MANKRKTLGNGMNESQINYQNIINISQPLGQGPEKIISHIKLKNPTWVRGLANM